MKKCLIDAGPLIALFNKDDFYHKTVVDFLKDYNGALFTSWPAVTEVFYMLGFSVKAQLDFLSWIKTGGLQISNNKKDSIDRYIELVAKYSDVPMDLADASLMVISEELGISDIVTLDSDFNIYRNEAGHCLNNLLNYTEG